jgi:hypothetical protein
VLDRVLKKVDGGNNAGAEHLISTSKSFKSVDKDKVKNDVKEKFQKKVNGKKKR